MKALLKLLKSNPYPGRGIAMGLGSGGNCFYIAYFITGRSENSRNRILEQDGQGVRIRAFEPSKLTDPSLIIYNPVRLTCGWTVVSNGDQTDTICEHISSGASFESALKQRRFEPDAPHFTPRISGAVDSNGRFILSILKNAGDGKACLRQFFDYSEPVAGAGYYISTYAYAAPGEPLPSFEGEPSRFSLDSSFEGFTASIWDSLDRDNKISLFTRRLDLHGGGQETIILNKKEGA